MREPDFELDGWCLEDAEERHRESPKTFWIPALEDRRRLGPGDHAKLIFRIAVDDPAAPAAVERMWVLVRERAGEGWFGLLDNHPRAIAENDEFWSGVEIPFASRHVIDIEPGDESTLARAMEEPLRRWPRD
jgi:hypothetical protein